MSNTIATINQTSPRGILKGFDIEKLRAKRTQGDGKKLWERLVTRTREHIVAMRASKFELYYGAIGWHDQTPCVLEAALMVLLEDDKDALVYVEECIAQVVAKTQKIRKDNPNAKLVEIHSHARVAMAADMLRGKLSAKAMEALLGFMRHTAIDYNRGAEGYHQFSAGSNIQFAHNSTAGVCALLWGEDCGHPEWREVVDTAIIQTRCYLKYGCDESGFSYEGTGYGHGCFAYMYPFVEVLKISGYADLYETEPRLKNILESSLRGIFPTGEFLVNDNDVGLIGAASLFYLLMGYREFKNPLYLSFWNAYQGPEHPIRPYGDMLPWVNKLVGTPGLAIEGTSTLFYTMLYWEPEAAYTPLAKVTHPVAAYAQGTERADIRTSWSSDAVYVNILGSGRDHHSQTHRHADAGHFSIFAHGEYLAIDTGRYNSNEDQHNVVMVEGKNAYEIEGWGIDQMSGRLGNFQHLPELTYVKADMAKMKNCYWADRHFLVVNHGVDEAYIVTVDDINVDNQFHSYVWQLQANQGGFFTMSGPESATLHNPKARLDIEFVIPSPLDHPANPHKLELSSGVQEWQWPYGRTQAIEGVLKAGVLQSSVSRQKLSAKLTGANGVIMAVMSPRKAGQATIGVERIQHKRALEVRVKTDKYIDTIIAAPNRAVINTKEVHALSELVFVRRDLSGKVLKTWSVDGAEVKVGARG